MKSKEFYRREPLVVRLEYDESTVTYPSETCRSIINPYHINVV
jgi:hypothetical protein